MGQLRRLIKNGAILSDSLSDLDSVDRDWGLIANGAPTIKTSPFGPRISFNGSTDYLRKTEANWQSNDSLGAITAWVKFGATGSANMIWTSADEASTNRYLIFFKNTTDYLEVDQINTGAGDAVRGGTFLTANRWYHVALTSDGLAYKLYVDGVAETLTVVGGSNSGDWLADTTLRDNIVIGALRRTTVVSHFNGEIGDVTYWSRELSATEILQLATFKTFDYKRNLVSHWRMDDAGIVRDVGWKENGFDLTGMGLVASTDLVNGIAGGRAIEFNGSDEYTRRVVNDWQSSDSQGTITAWIKRAAMGTAHVVFGSGGPDNNRFFAFRVWSTDKLEISQMEGAGTQNRILGGTTFVTDRWYHVAAVSTGTAYHLYVDGVEESLTVLLGANDGKWIDGTTGRDNIAVGVIDAATTLQHFDGVIDEVQYYDVGLTNLQIRDIYEQQRVGKI